MRFVSLSLSKQAFGVSCYVSRVFGALSAGGWLPSALAFFVFLFGAMLKGGVCVLNFYICSSLNVLDIYYACLCVFEYLCLGSCWVDDIIICRCRMELSLYIY